MNKRILLFLTMFIFIYSFAYKQKNKYNNYLLQELEIILFPEGKEMMPIAETFDCDNQRVNSTYLIRKNQPVNKEVLSILEKITLTKDTVLFAPLLMIYNRHLEFVKKEWEAVFKQNIYMCESAKEQFMILTGFETTLHSLYFGGLNLSSKEKYEYHKKFMGFAFEYIFDVSTRDETLKKLPNFSSYTQDLRQNNWMAHSPNFGYLTPYMKELETFFIDEIQSFAFDTTKALNIDEYFITHNNIYLEKIQDAKLDQVLKERFNHWASANKQPWIYAIAGKTERNNQKIIEFLTEQLFSNPNITKWKWEYRDYLMRSMFWTADKKNVVKSYLLEKIKNGENGTRIDAIKFMSRFHEASVITQLKHLSKKANFSEEEKKETQNTILLIDKSMK